MTDTTISPTPLADRPNLRAALSGVNVVLVTGYDRAGAVDPGQCENLAIRADASGLPSMTALGNTAEVHQLDNDERRQVLESVAQGRSRAALIAGATGARSVVLETIRIAQQLRYDAAMIHEPPDPFGDGVGLEAYYLKIADTSPLPVVLYLRSERLRVDQLTRLSSHPNIVAMKWARSDLGPLAELTASTHNCIWINGAAESAVPALAAVGVHAFTSGIANARPDASLAIHAAVVRGDLACVTSVLRQIAVIERLRAANHARHNVAVIKELLKALGHDLGEVRAPHVPLDTSTAATVRATLAAWPEDFRAPTTTS